MANGPDRLPAAGPLDATQQHPPLPTRGRMSDAPAASGLKGSAGAEDMRTRSGRRSFLTSAKETSWISRGRKGMTDMCTGSYGYPAGRSSPKARLTPGKKRAIAGAACLATVLLLAALIAFLLGGHTPSLPETKLCDTLPCRLHAQLLTRDLNRSIDPCEDFSAFVCSSWLPPTNRREHVKTPVDDTAFSRLAIFRELLIKGALKFPVAAKALDMYKYCMNAEDHGGAYLPQFLALMREMGLSWPEPPLADADPLGLLVALSYRWQVHLWFEIRVLTRRGEWLLAFSPAPSLPFLLDQYKAVKDRRSFAVYWMGYYRDLHLNTTAPVDHASLQATIEETRNMEGTVLTQLCKLIFTRMRTPAAFRLADIGNHSEPITADTWMNLLRENVALRPELAATDDVNLSDENLLKTVGGLLGDYQRPRLFSLFGWTFVQMFVPIGEPRMLLRRFGARHKVEVYRSQFCSFHTESTYRALVLSLEVAIDDKEKDREVIAAGFQKLVSTAVKKVEGASWLDDDGKRVASEKLRSVKMRAWPEEQLLNNEALEEIYKEYPSTGQLFVELWIQARRVTHRASGRVRSINDSQVYWEALKLPSNFPPSYPRLDYVLDTLDVPTYMVYPPLYYSGGTNSMFFGGLGYLLAYNLVRALDKEGVRWLPNGTEVECIFSEETRKAYQERDSCLSSYGLASVFPELPATEIAYAAMEDSDNGNVVYIAEDISPAKALFMTMCYMSCTIHGFQSALAADSNKIVRNSAAFASAFDCPTGSKMNPPKKCNFFG
ncbi:hypothetical protein V5799_019689 [Amblyomma americanum]|uniref:Peptidase M13 N-terminal domain-containing protein n=1 Tax=Amblyomma americanum TaxID=6943 RepID=A0AAQ4EWM8_AMBAM